MRIEITGRFTDQEISIVRFSSRAGHGAGMWNGGAAPTPGAIYDIEFEVLSVLEIGTNCSFVTERVPSIRTVGNKVSIVGAVEGIDADKVGSLRLATDCPVTDCLVSVEFADHNVFSGSQIELNLNTTELLLYPPEG